MIDAVQSADSPARTEVITSRLERWGVALILTVYCIVQLNNIYNRAFLGQDFQWHAKFTEETRTNPGQWFHQDPTNRPLIYWVGAACKNFTHERYGYELTALIFVLASASALFVTYLSLRPFIVQPGARLSALCFITFLPCTVITAVVYAADTAAFLPFAGLCWGLQAYLKPEYHRLPRSCYAAIATLALCVGMLAKAPFGWLPLGILVLCLYLLRTNKIQSRAAWILAVSGVLFPLFIAACIQIGSVKQLKNEPVRRAFNWHGTGQMTWSNMFIPQSRDLHIFDAPGYWDKVTIDGVTIQPMLMSNAYSYPALMVLSVFTDVLDFANLGAIDNGSPRPDDKKAWAQLAVRFGAIAFCVGLVATSSFILKVFRGFCRKNAEVEDSGVLWLVLSLTWFAPIFFALPFVENVFAWGYWLPRLILPAIWGFAVLSFYVVSAWLRGRPKASLTLGVLVVFQAFVHVLSMWY